MIEFFQHHFSHPFKFILIAIPLREKCSVFVLSGRESRFLSIPLEGRFICIAVKINRVSHKPNRDP